MNDTSLKHLRAILTLPVVVTIIIPAVLLILFGGPKIGWALTSPFNLIPILGGLLLIGLGLFLLITTISMFARFGEGTLAPWDAPQKLVVRGVYRHVRNPMHTGVFVMLFGEGLLLGSPAILFFATGAVILHLFYIPLSEEKGLEQRFGEDYLIYKQHVPRWIPRLKPWVWISGIGAVIVVGIIGLLALLNGGGQPSETPVPTEAEEPAVAAEATQAPTLAPTDPPTPTSTPEATVIPPDYPGYPITNNDQWTPVIDEFNGMQMAFVPAGCFMMGSTEEKNEQPVHKVCFDEPFWIDVYEVTNEAFGSTGCESYSSEPDQPRNCVNWIDSLAHCESRGARLPTEAEWEYAARGPDGLVYPWGNDFVADNVVGLENSYGQTAPGGSKPGGVSWVGVYDLSGNLWEWVSDWYDADYYASSREVNPQGPENGQYRVLRGGSWDVSYSTFLRGAYRYNFFPPNGGNHFGFRCARSY